VLVDELVEALARFGAEDGGLGEQAQRARIHGGDGLVISGFGAAGARAVDAGGGLLGESSHGVYLRSQGTQLYIAGWSLGGYGVDRKRIILMRRL
jgi:hypothetical protein